MGVITLWFDLYCTVFHLPHVFLCMKCHVSTLMRRLDSLPLLWTCKCSAAFLWTEYHTKTGSSLNFNINHKTEEKPFLLISLIRLESQLFLCVLIWRLIPLHWAPLSCFCSCLLGFNLSLSQPFLFPWCCFPFQNRTRMAPCQIFACKNVPLTSLSVV